ncbi:MAG: LCP family protein [Acidimicrobiia bacterium]|nr:MAG: LCP family protein [Acidimicrobiia bacterium]
MRAGTALAAWTLLLGACGGGAAATSTTVPAEITTTTRSATTTVAASSTEATLGPPPETRAAVTVAFEGEPAAGAAVAGFYAWLGDRSRLLPDVPFGLVDHVWAVSFTEDVDLVGSLYAAETEEGSVAVARVDDDVVLLVDDGSGWRVVGADLTRFDLGPWYGDPIRHVLVLGSDARPGESQRLYRADSIHVLSSNVDARAGAIMGFPRDTLVEASYGDDKFTHVNAVSETHSEEMVEIARSLSGLPIEGYLITGFSGFTALVNDFGGVQVRVPYPMVDWRAEANLVAGLQRLWGAAALAFSRVRSIPGGDFTRSLHQGEVIAAALAAIHERSVTDLPALVAILADHTWTDLTLEQLLTLGAQAFYIDPEKVGNVVLPGRSQLVKGASVVVLEEAGAEKIYRDLDDGKLDEAG